MPKTIVESERIGIVALHLTDGHGPDLSAALKETQPGMAHIAGTGPEGKTCRECVHWGVPKRIRNDDGELVEPKPGTIQPYAYGPGGELRKRRCLRFKRLMGGVNGKTVPHYLSACRHFDATSNPPPILEVKLP